LTPTKTVLDVLRAGEGWLRQREVDAPKRSMELMLGHVLGLRRLDLYLAFDRPMTEAELLRMRALLQRRGEHEPLAYVLGEVGFRTVMVRCDRRALVPRPETEDLVELALARAPQGGRVLDLGTGSGAIALALAVERPDLAITATDASPDALALADENFVAAGVRARVDLRLGSWFAPVAGLAFDVVVSNPPYVDPAQPELLADDVRRFEPHAALFTPPGDPAACYREIVAGAMSGLVPGGWILFETGVEAAGSALAVLQGQTFLTDVELRPDLAGLPRYLLARRAP
jgi:release factor glutamine methyltransferase